MTTSERELNARPGAGPAQHGPAQHAPALHGPAQHGSPPSGDGSARRELPRTRLVERAVRKTARNLRRTVNAPTGSARLLPGFLIAGAQRCGTSSLSWTLSSHPAVFTSVGRQEVHYFDLNYGRGINWYKSHFPLAARARRAAAKARTTPVAFESSPYYLFHPLAAERIARDLPDVKLLVLLRDPVQRAYSAHAHALHFGQETEPFERALELEDARLEGEDKKILADPGYVSYHHQHHSYRVRGRYAEQLEHLAQHVGRDRIHVIDSGRFFTDPGPVYDEVLDFLGLPRLGGPVFGRRNASPKVPPMSAAVRAQLTEYYQPHDERLVAWLGGAPSWRA